MSEIESLIYKFNNMCGESETEMGDLAQAELDDLRRFIQVGIEILEARDKGLSVATDALIDKKLRRLIYESKLG
jgi:hypothetical protein